MALALPNDLQITRNHSGLASGALVSQESIHNKKSIVKVPKSSVRWSSAEDEMLLRIVQTMESPKWKLVAQHFYRNQWACQQRYEKLKRRCKTYRDEEKETIEYIG